MFNEYTIKDVIEEVIDYRGKTPSVISLGNPYGTCCCCGKALTREDKFYYDLDSYCIDCAILDGIRTSK